MADPKNPDLNITLGEVKSAQDAKPEVEVNPDLKIGDKVRVRAVYGFMYHPFAEGVSFDTEKITKAEVDSWLLVQLKAGKLAIDD